MTYFIGVLAGSEAAKELKRIWYLQYFLQALDERDRKRRRNEE